MEDREDTHAQDQRGQLVPMDDQQSVPAERDTKGRFTAGNQIGKGRPIGSKVDRLRRAMISAVTPDDIREIISVLIGLAKAGDLTAAKIVLDRVLGSPVPIDLMERLDELERFAAERGDS